MSNECPDRQCMCDYRYIYTVLLFAWIPLIPCNSQYATHDGSTVLDTTRISSSQSLY